MKCILQIQDKSTCFDYPKPKLKIKIIFLINGEGAELFLPTHSDDRTRQQVISSESAV